MNIVFRELRANMKPLVVWCVGIVFLIFGGMIKYAAIAAVGQNATDLFKELPAAMQSILGLNTLDITSVSGYYGVFFLYFMLLAGTHAVMMGAVIISKEERDKTADFLFSKPVMRTSIVAAKLTAALINLLILNLTTLAASIIFTAKYNRGESINHQIIYLMAALFILQLLFASVGAAISGLTHNSRQATSQATALFLAAYVLSAAIDVNNKIAFLTPVTPFKYFPAAEIMNGHYDPFSLLLSASIIIGCTAVTGFLFKNRDIYI